MENLILQPTSLAQWYALVNEAEVITAQQLGEELESYLVFLLMRFAEKPQIAQSVLSLDFLESVNARGCLRQDSLKEVGDKCLLFSGLFPERALKRHVTVNYFVDLGQTAYGTLSDYRESELSQLFASLCNQFNQLKDTLHAMRDITHAEKKYSVGMTEIRHDLH